MSQTQAVPAQNLYSSRQMIWPWVAVVATLVAYVPTFITLAQGPWQTEQEGHGPLIIAAAIWLVWQSRDRLRAAQLAPSPVLGWVTLLGGLAVLVVSRNQD